ncbi:MAG: fatty acid hydroxylase [Bacteroidetes bacterium 46-16]|nr:MAG: fatty acid hydroxylase [Bacteroidetes bacterium 46-16]
MQADKIKNKGQGRLFKNEYLETMTKTHPLVIFSIYLPIIGFMLYYGITYKGMSAGQSILLFAVGALSWSLFEYLIHRYLFHLVAHTERSKRLVYTMHGIHHEFPRDRERLFMPPIPSFILASILFTVFKLLLGVQVFAFFPGFIAGYLVYGSMHYAIHAFAPPKFMKALWRNHHLHHYKYPDKGFGVSSILWDVIFRSMPRKEKA